jgi:hypothetical protein
MAKWVHSDILDNGLNGIKNNAIRMTLVSAYSAGDSYATVIGNKLAEVTMTGTDFTLGSSGNNRTLTTAAGKSASATASSASPDLHIAFHDNSSKVLWVTDETSNQAITSGNTVNFPSIVYTSQQPT